jgi:pyruvate dehydrogenase complex dehydrogenase (E1) component
LIPYRISKRAGLSGRISGQPDIQCIPTLEHSFRIDRWNVPALAWGITWKPKLHWSRKIATLKDSVTRW